MALRSVQQALRTWSKQNFSSVTRELEALRTKLEELKGSPPVDRQVIRRTTDRMDELLYREEMMWLQRSRLAWLRVGDKNTSYFQQQAVWRARKNRIKKLKDVEGNWQEDPQMLKRMTTDFFKNLYQADSGVVPTELLDFTKGKITQEMNEYLCKEFTDQEISDALFQMGPLKAPGPDGFPACFFQHHWETLRDDVIHAVRKFFNDGIMPPGINDTAIVLIPKGNSPSDLKDFRPISLCNVIYKIISKCLVNRLRPTLDDIISPEQSAFVPGRLITENAIIAFECIHAIQRGTWDREEFCAYKLDLSKAYDRVDWGFLKSLLVKLGFQSKWVQWIMTCVSSVRYTVRFNGVSLAPFAPSRGLRQGDLLSPYIFLLVDDGLSVLLKRLEQQGRLEGLKVCRRAPSISHLLFADDSHLFFRANATQAQNIKETLSIFERCTGQLVSSSKCSLLVRAGSRGDQVQQVRAILGVERVDFEEKYLGLPTPKGRMKRDVFQPLEQRFLKRMTAWKEKELSAVGKEILIKSVAPALPNYIMSIFKLTNGLCEDLMKAIRAYWWGSEKGRRRMQWVPWKTLVLPKYLGGMGFKDLILFNQALLAKQAWRLITYPDSLCARVLKAKYFPNGNLLDTVVAGDTSQTWRAIEHGLYLLKKGVVWRVGDGSAIRIWRDNWIPRPYGMKPIGSIRPCRLRRVSHLIDQVSGSWDEA
jgi:hypothetical protein